MVINESLLTPSRMPDAVGSAVQQGRQLYQSYLSWRRAQGNPVSRDALRERLRRQLLASNMFQNREGLVGEPYLPRNPGESVQAWQERVLDAIDERFDDRLYELYLQAQQSGAIPQGHDFVGFVFDRVDNTRFDAASRRIVFSLTRSLNKFSVAEEVQHAIDYTLGARDPNQILQRGIDALARTRNQTPQVARANLSEADVTWINNWWHRRVFTRLIKNVHEGNHGLDYLQSRIDEMYALYREIGGRLTLDEIRTRTWDSVY